MNLDVLLTDGHYKHTYAILRALVEKGLSVGILFNKKLSLSLFSKYVTKRFIVSPDIYKNESIYLQQIINVLKNNVINVLLPVGNITYNVVSKHKAEIEKFARIPIVTYDKMYIAQNKSETFKFAKTIGYPMPITYFINSLDEIENIAKTICYPAVIKKVNPQETGVIYCNNANELMSNYLGIAKSIVNRQELPIIQEYIEGKGVGFYGLFNQGKCVAYFMHERIHEYPITGGASTLAKSNYNETLKRLGIKILSDLKWHGVAMVEFKEDKNGNYKLIEINPKFWGSLELSYVAGINFAYLAYLAALNLNIPQTTYKKNIYFRWILPHDVLWKRFASLQEKREYIILKHKVKIYNNIHLDDPLTVLYNIFFTGYKLFTEKKYPHGRIAE